MKQTLFALLLLVRCILPATAQVDEAPPPLPVQPVDAAEKVYEMFDIQKQPAFPGGEAEMMRFIGVNIKYPALARENNIQGVVALTFVVDKTGKVTNINIIKDIGGGCGKEAARVLAAMPQWAPGEANGRPVAVRYTLPVRFRLTDDDISVAMYPGGENAMKAYLEKNLVYPKKALKKKLEGTVVVSCYISPIGKIVNAKIEKSLSKECDAEALRLVKHMPSWMPRLDDNNQAVLSKVEIEVPFKLPAGKH